MIYIYIIRMCIHIYIYIYIYIYMYVVAAAIIEDSNPLSAQQIKKWGFTGKCFTPKCEAHIPAVKS